MSENPRIAVVGSVNLDLVIRVARFPAPGETLTGAELSRFPGGKGGNQALAARRLGAEVHMVACVGDDMAADEALAQLKAEGVSLACCRRLAGVSTGLAMILVDDSGQNQIVVAPGANAGFSPDFLELPECDGVIAQLEIPMGTLVQAAERHGGFFCLNAAPARPLAPELLARTDLLVVNEVEAETL
ncbi:MAG: ribokinase, partial [Gammaproteobacteria bacterium]|nr:ribokinase [Gammaproteobacteria bacterium]